MAGPERLRTAGAVGAIACAAAIAVGCASGGSKSAQKPAPLEPAPPAAARSADGEAARPVPSVDLPSRPAPAPPGDPAPRPAGPDPTLIVIDAASSSEARPQTLAQAAAAERERRGRVADQPAKVVITNKNLASYAAGGVLTIANPDATSSADASAGETAEAKQLATREAYWRQRGLEIRQRWHDSVASIKSLEAKAEALRTRFYSTDDPAVRDTQIKPEWDKALADLEQAHYQAAHGKQEVEEYLEAGRKAGALPGWLREGVDLEPEPVIPQADEIDTTEPQEPRIYPEDHPEPPVVEEPPPPSAPRI